MRVFNGIGEVLASEGEFLGQSEWVQITQENIDKFAEATLDHQWIHVDVARAAAGPFGTTIAHGFLTLSYVPHLTNQIYRFDGISMGINYGCNKVRFPNPVPSDSWIRADATLREADGDEKQARLAIDVRIDIRGQDKPACIAETAVVLFA